MPAGNKRSTLNNEKGPFSIERAFFVVNSSALGLMQDGDNIYLKIAGCIH